MPDRDPDLDLGPGTCRIGTRVWIWTQLGPGHWLRPVTTASAPWRPGGLPDHRVGHLTAALDRVGSRQ